MTLLRRCSGGSKISLYHSASALCCLLVYSCNFAMVATCSRNCDKAQQVNPQATKTLESLCHKEIISSLTIVRSTCNGRHKNQQLKVVHFEADTNLRHRRRPPYFFACVKLRTSVQSDCWKLPFFTVEPKRARVFVRIALRGAGTVLLLYSPLAVQ